MAPITTHANTIVNRIISGRVAREEIRHLPDEAYDVKAHVGLWIYVYLEDAGWAVACCHSTVRVNSIRTFKIVFDSSHSSILASLPRILYVCIQVLTSSLSPISSGEEDVYIARFFLWITVCFPHCFLPGAFSPLKRM